MITARLVKNVSGFLGQNAIRTGVRLKSKRQELGDSLKSSGIVPQLIVNVPPKQLNVDYTAKGAKSAKADSGNEIAPVYCKFAPTVKWECKDKDLHAFFFLDIDSHSPGHTSSNFVHWLVVNVPGMCLCKGEHLTGYLPPVPPKESGLHRYVFLVYEQPCEICFHEIRVPSECMEGRANFDLETFTKNYLLKQPVACNYFVAKWDPFVDKLLKCLGMM